MKMLFTKVTAVAAAMLLTVGSVDLDAAGVRALGSIPGHKGAVNSLTFSNDSQTILSSSVDGTVKTWTVKDGSMDRVVGRTRYGVNDAAYSPDNHFVVTASNRGGVQIWEAASGKLHRSLSGATDPQLTVATSPDGQYIASGSSTDKVTIWRASDTEPLHVLKAHDGVVTSVAFSPDGQYLATIGMDGTIKVWEVATGYRAFSMRTDGPLNDLAFAPDGKTLAVAGEDVRVFVMNTGQIIQTLREHGAPVRTVSFSPNGKFLVTGSSDKTAKIWSVTTGRVITTLEEQNGSVVSAAFSPDGLYLATGSEASVPTTTKKRAKMDTTIVVWDLQDIYSDGRISLFVERQLYHWKRKGEFEKLADYQARMDKIDLEAGRLFTEAFRKFNDDVREGATVSTYDAENEQFIIGLPSIGKFPVHVPISKAKIFKKNFSDVVFRNFIVEPEIRVPAGSSWKLKKVELYLPTMKQSFFYGEPK